MKVAHCILGYWPHVGGAEVSAQKLINKLNNNNISVEVFTRHFVNLDNSIKANYKINRVFKDKFFGSKEISSFIIFFKLLFSNHDLIHVHQCNVLAFFCCLVGYIKNKPVIIKIANSGEKFDFNTLNNRIFGSTMMNIILFTKPTFICLSKIIENNVNNYSNKKCKTIVIPNGSDIKELDLKRNQITFIGRYEEVKQPLFFCEIAKHFKDFSFEMYGDGSLYNHLNKLYANQPNIKIHKLLNNSEISSIYSKSLCVILPSTAEGMSNVLIESLLTSTPILASNLKENRIIFGKSEGWGVLVEGFNIDNWVKNLYFIINNKFDSNKELEDLKETYKLDFVCKNYIKLYQELIEGVK